MPRYGTSDLDPLFVLDAELAKYSVAIVPRLTLPHQLAVPLDIPGKSKHGHHNNTTVRCGQGSLEDDNLGEELYDSLKDGPALSWPP
jgi:hypothetical protein